MTNEALQRHQIDALVRAMSAGSQAALTPVLQGALDAGVSEAVVAAAVAKFQVYMIAALACDLAPEDPPRLGAAMLDAVRYGAQQLDWRSYQLEKAAAEAAGRA